MGNLVKCRNHVSNVADHEGFPGLKVQDMRGTNPRVWACEYQKLHQKSRILIIHKS